jgi:hypothetical protein
LTIAIVLGLASVVVTAGEMWMRTFAGPDDGAFFDIILTEDGDVLVVSAMNHLHLPPYLGDALLMKQVIRPRFCGSTVRRRGLKSMSSPNPSNALLIGFRSCWR